MKLKGLVVFCLFLSIIAGCKCPVKKAAKPAVDQEKEPAVAVEDIVVEEPVKTPAADLVTKQPPAPAVVPPSQEGKATPQQIAKAIKDEPIPAVKIPEDKDFQAPVEKSPEAAKTFQNINFDFDKYDIRPDARVILDAIGKYLMENPKVSVLIQGHCDEKGTREYNLVLGEQRALSTRRYLVAAGISPDRLFTVSYGKDMPLDPASNEEAWAQNRRAEFKVTE